jgi:SAM-dependent methyltransferase
VTEPNEDTRSDAYATYLKAPRAAASLRQLPYRTHLRFLKLGVTLDIGCGVGRNLGTLGAGSVGIDHNEFSVDACRQAGFEAFVPGDFLASPHAIREGFESLLLSHVAEHMPFVEAVALLARYRPFVRKGGRIVVFTPQERGYATDATHVEFVDFRKAVALARDAELTLVRQYSFPLPRVFGTSFAYNEFVTVAIRPESD